MKCGRMTMDCVAFLKSRPLTSERAMAMRMDTAMEEMMNRAFRKMVLKVTWKNALEPKNALKFIRPINSLPQSPSVGRYRWKAVSR